MRFINAFLEGLALGNLVTLPCYLYVIIDMIKKK